MNTYPHISPSHPEITAIHGPQLIGIWQKLGVALWSVLFILCLSASVMSISFGDFWYRTPYSEILKITPTQDSSDVAETLKPFQDAIFNLGLTLDGYAHYFTILRILAGLPYFILGFLIIRRRSDRLIAVLFAGALCILGAAGTWFNPLWAWIPESYPWHPLLNTLLGIYLFFCIAILYVFPDGHFVPRWTRWLFVLLVPYTILSFLFPETPLNPDTWADPIGFLMRVFFLGVGLFAMIYRYRHHADPVQRQQIKWFVAGSILIALNYFADLAVWEIYPTLTGNYLITAGSSAVLWELYQDTSWYIAEFVFAVCVAISIFRYRLWDIDLILNRVLVYFSLTALTMLVYLVAVSTLGSLFRDLADQWEFFLATGLVAILFEPLRQRLQRIVNRLMYGERDDPYSVLMQLSSRLETVPDPDKILPALVTQTRQALKLPYTAIYLEQNGEQQKAADSGNPQNDLLSFPLIYQETTIGSLQVANRAPGEVFSRLDQRLLENIARQTSAAAQSVRLHIQLVRSRAQIVNEREEERRRIRRDLHDELGPILASQSLKLAAASRLIHSAPEKAENLVNELTQQSQEIVKEIRRLVHGLRPPALDQLGLVEAIRDFVRERKRVGASGQEMGVEIITAPEGLPELPAAIEVNAYRIVLEALTNISRHAQAQACTVKFLTEKQNGPESLPVALLIQISDDGQGIPNHFREGVGMRSMRERAEEIGGRFTFEPCQPRGTQITVWLPLAL